MELEQFITKPIDLTDQVERKFVESFDLDDWEIETDHGWSDIARIGKTIPYQVFELKTTSAYCIWWYLWSDLC